MKEVVLRSENVNKHFGITHAVKDVTLEFYRGEVHGLIGENGSGKSTYCSMLSGIHSISSGRFLLEGEELKVKSLVDANMNGISIVVQEMGTLSGLSVAENIFLGREHKFMHGFIKDTALMNKETQQLLDSYGLKRINASTIIDNYSFEDRKLIEIVKATYFEPLVVTIDETTTALSQNGREELFKIIEHLKETNKTVIFISHDLSEVLAHTDRISVLRDGELVKTVNSHEVDADDLKRLMVGRELDNRYYRTDYDGRISNEVVLSVSNLSVSGEFENVSLDLHKGEILGIGGLSECGMHELGKAIFGGSYDRSGTVKLPKTGVEITSIPQAIKNGIAYTSKDRDNESIVLANTISDNITLPSLDILAKKRVLKKKDLHAFAQKHADQMSVRMTGIKQYVFDLSGGNKQKVVLARWLGRDSDILIFDSPTRGIDVKVKADIYALMTELKERGKSIIMISEEILELIGMSDRIVIMKNGQINGTFTRSEELGEEDLIAKMV